MVGGRKRKTEEGEPRVVPVKTILNSRERKKIDAASSRLMVVALDAGERERRSGLRNRILALLLLVE
jgi:hypothetical protein